MGTLLYPSLGSAAAERLVADQQSLPLHELLTLGTVSHPDAAPAPTGGLPASASQIQQVQTAVRDVARAAGYPSPLKRSDTQRFDRPCGTALLATLDIVTANAADEGVWSFLSLVVVPEIGAWRFPERHPDRLLGRPRNTLRRLWWRAWALGADLEFAPDGCSPLGEDEFVQIMERPRLGHHRALTRAIRDAAWRAEKRGLRVGRSEIVRGLTVRAGALKVHRALELLPDEELAAVLDGLVEDATRAELARRPTP